MTDKPRIRIVNEGVMGHETHVYDENGTEITSAITQIDLTLSAAEPNRAVLHMLKVGVELDAIVDEVKARTLPPVPPKVQYRFRITEGSKTADRWVLEKVIPLPTFGVKEEFMCGGALAKGGPLIELIGDAPEVEPVRSEELPDENVIYEAP